MSESQVQIKKQVELIKIWKLLPYLLILLSLIFVIGITFVHYASVERKITDTIAKYLDLKLSHIYISGFENANVEDVRLAIGVKKGDYLFSAKPDAIREQLEALSWVRLAQVQRVLPDTLNIKIFEHKAIATIMFNNKRWALNSKGELIDTVGEDFNYLLELSGDEAKEQAAMFFSLFSDWSDLLFFLKRADFVGKRRWNLYLENGTLVMLPEENVRYALKVLSVLDDQQKILDKYKIKIDLRNVKKHIIIDEKSNVL
ncbi:MAG: FtsQ-type POTRA domain-containing protein [Proteobacteria bacterium]|nr:FtsQ-type POTRA domain-containing protein [Pseudomonadota bacterium]